MVKKLVVVMLVLSLTFILSAGVGTMKSAKAKKLSVKKKIKKTEKKLEKSKNVKVLMKTSMGDIELELFPEKAPITVSNFLAYVKKGFYDGLIFHRVIKNFMIQGGGFDEQGNQKKPLFPPIKNEATNGLSNETGTIAMARTPIINSATCQFFINVKDNNFLDHKDNGAGFGYAVFGKVIKGMDVVHKIENVQTQVNPEKRMKDWPVKNVVIKKVIIEK